MSFTKPLVEHILRNAAKHEWSIQGFGMIRTYLGPKSNPKEIRLNIWDSSLAVPNVSTIHDHPWDFSSEIVAGCFVNVRYDVPENFSSLTHSYIKIKTGIGGGYDPNAIPGAAGLLARRPELYMEGDVYTQIAREIHESIPYDGTVTINRRVGDTEKARVFWPYGTAWVDAIPRKAQIYEVETITQRALRKWF